MSSIQSDYLYPIDVPPTFQWDDAEQPGDFECAFDEIHRQAELEHQESCEESDARGDLIDSLCSALLGWYVAMDNLLKILYAHGYEELPPTARSLRGNEKVNVVQRSGMQYVYLGIKAGLVRCLEALPPIRLHNQILETAGKHTHLGLTLSRDLTWGDHISHLERKCGKMLGLLKR